MDEKEEEKQWAVCCSKTSRACIMYTTQVCAAGIVMAVALYQLSTDTKSRELWISLLSSSVGLLLPNPKLS